MWKGGVDDGGGGMKSWSSDVMMDEYAATSMMRYCRISCHMVRRYAIALLSEPGPESSHLHYDMSVVCGMNQVAVMLSTIAVAHNHICRVRFL